MNHIVESRPLTKLADGGLLQLHSANDNSVNWLRDEAIKALGKYVTLILLIITFHLEIIHIQILIWHGCIMVWASDL